MSAVTAVPLRPLAKGSLLKMWVALGLLIAAAAGLAWWSTRWMQGVTLASGVRIQTLRAGAGPVMTDADVMTMRYLIHRNTVDGPVVTGSGERPRTGTVQDLPAGFSESVKQMRAGGRYVVWVPARIISSGQPIPPSARFTMDDTLVIETEVLQIEAGQASAFQMQRIQDYARRQELMRQQQGAGGQPGVPSAMPPQGAPDGPQGPAMQPPAPGGR